MHNSKNNIVHIGLGKTATSSLQRGVFTELSVICNELTYNDSRLLPILAKKNRGIMTGEDARLAQALLKEKRHLISNEGLVDWNPRNWELAADENVFLFGRQTTILITVRDPSSYLRSVYQQTVQEGNVKKPEEFFVSGTEYDQLSGVVPPRLLNFFDLDAFDLYKLKKLYEERFDDVRIICIDDLAELKFLQGLIELSSEDLARLKTLFVAQNIKNRSYSDIGMKLTFMRSNILTFFGLRNIGGNDINYLSLIRSGHYSRTATIKKPWRHLNLKTKFREAPSRSFYRILRLFRWRVFIQDIIDKIIPYRRYHLHVVQSETLTGLNKRFIEEHRFQDQ